MRSSRSATALAVVLAGIAGTVDAVGFLHLHGYFVSFMSGNSTRLGVGLGADGAADARTAGALIGIFFIGAMAGAVINRLVRRHRRPTVLAVVAAVLGLAAIAGAAGVDGLASGAMAFAMGCENAVFARGGTVGTGLTYMTGNLVKTAHGLVAALSGGDRTAWTGDALLWVGLASGAVLGARLFTLFGVPALGIAAGATVLCAVWTVVDPRLDG